MKLLRLAAGDFPTTLLVDAASVESFLQDRSARVTGIRAQEIAVQTIYDQTFGSASYIRIYPAKLWRSPVHKLTSCRERSSP